MLEYLQPISQKTVRINLLRYMLNCHESGELFSTKYATINLTNFVWTTRSGAALSVTKAAKEFLTAGALARISKSEYQVINTAPIIENLVYWESHYGFREKIIPAEKIEERRIRRKAYDKARCTNGKAKPATQWVSALDDVMMNLGR